MHRSSFDNMKKFVERYVTEPCQVADIGSQDINGSYKTIFNDDFDYVGVDIKKGKNVNTVVKDPYQWKELKNNSFDVVISGQTLEHVEHDEKVIKEIHRILKPGGLCCIIVPSAGYEHDEPDFRRYTNEGLNGLLTKVGFSVIEAYMDESLVWRDIISIVRKGSNENINNSASNKTGKS